MFFFSFELLHRKIAQFCPNPMGTPDNLQNVNSFIEKSSKSVTPVRRSRRLSQLETESPYKCIYCSMKFMTEPSAHMHNCRPKYMYMQVHNTIKNPFCKYCGKHYATKLESQEHVCAASEKRFECSVCKRRFMTKYILNKHQIIHRKENLWCCKHCSEIFECDDDVYSHERVHEWIGSIEPYQPFRCKDSRLIFQSIDEDAESDLGELNRKNVSYKDKRSTIVCLQTVLEEIEKEIQTRSDDSFDVSSVDADSDRCKESIEQSTKLSNKPNSTPSIDGRNNQNDSVISRKRDATNEQHVRKFVYIFYLNCHCSSVIGFFYFDNFASLSFFLSSLLNKLIRS